jgi:uncharacterized protein (DUF2336 family)
MVGAAGTGLFGQDGCWVVSTAAQSSHKLRVARAPAELPVLAEADIPPDSGDEPYRPPETMVWLALNGGHVMRRAVAANRNTPGDVNAILAGDSDAQIRAALARKISWRLSADHDPDHASTLRVLERLARDPSALVRGVLSHEIRYLCGVPPAIARALAHDPDPAVAAPILECSPHLSEAELMAFVLDPAARFARTAIACRRPIGRDLCDAIVFFLDAEALMALLANPEAKLRRTAIEHIARNAERVLPCLEFLAERDDLSPRAVQRVARVADARVIERLLSKEHDAKTGAVLEAALRARRNESHCPVDTCDEAAIICVQEARSSGSLDETFVCNAAEQGEVEIVIASLVALTQLPDYAVRKVLVSRSTDAITDLARSAGFGLRTAYRILEFALKVPRPKRRAPPRGEKRRLMSFFLRAGAPNASPDIRHQVLG